VVLLKQDLMIVKQEKIACEKRLADVSGKYSALLATGAAQQQAPQQQAPQQVSAGEPFVAETIAGLQAQQIKMEHRAARIDEECRASQRRESLAQQRETVAKQHLAETLRRLATVEAKYVPPQASASVGAACEGFGLIWAGGGGLPPTKQPAYLLQKDTPSLRAPR
jgi:hypothetical protein